MTRLSKAWIKSMIKISAIVKHWCIGGPIGMSIEVFNTSMGKRLT